MSPRYIASALALFTAPVLRSRRKFPSSLLFVMAFSLFWLTMFRWILVRQLPLPDTMYRETCIVLFGSITETW